MKNTFNLLQSSHDIFTGEIVKNISHKLDEDAEGIQKALEMIIPVILYGLAEKVSTRYGAAEIAQRATDAYSRGVLEKIDSLPLQNNGASLFLLSDTFGFKAGKIINSISVLCGIKRSSVPSLMSLAVPAVLALLGKHKETSETGVATLLIFRQNGFIEDLPLELNLNDSYNEEEYAAATNSTKNKKNDLRGWRTGILTMIALGALLGWLFISGKNDHYATANGKETVQSETKKDSTIVSSADQGNSQ